MPGYSYEHAATILIKNVGNNRSACKATRLALEIAQSGQWSGDPLSVLHGQINLKHRVDI